LGPAVAAFIGKRCRRLGVDDPEMSVDERDEEDEPREVWR
jgi:hypothetical protein